MANRKLARPGFRNRHEPLFDVSGLASLGSAVLHKTGALQALHLDCHLVGKWQRKKALRLGHDIIQLVSSEAVTAEIEEPCIDTSFTQRIGRALALLERTLIEGRIEVDQGKIRDSYALQWRPECAIVELNKFICFLVSNYFDHLFLLWALAECAIVELNRFICFLGSNYFEFLLYSAVTGVE